MREWGLSEGRELINVRVNMDRDFGESKGNAVREARLWELIAAKMSFHCTGQDCKQQWKTLFTRYKRKDASGEDYPLFQQMDSIYKGSQQFYTFSDEEDSSSKNTLDDSDDEYNDESRDVQQVLEDLFQRMPCVPPGWVWQQEAVGKPSFSKQFEDGTKCKEELIEDRMRWGYAETKDLISLRAEMEDALDILQKNIWESIASKMSQRGHARNPEQCRRKWKKLINRYKGKRTHGQENGRRFIFFEEIDEIFNARLRRRNVALAELREDDKIKESTVENGHVSEDGESVELSRKKRKTEGMQHVLSDFIAKQQVLEREWDELMKRKQEEFKKRDEEWRSEMQKLHEQKIARELIWREREEQRLAREEIYTQKWDKLFDVLLNRITKD